MTTSRSPQHHPRPSLPLIAATTAALPAVVLSSLAIAQPAAAESRARAVPATLAAAMRAQAKADVATSLKAAVIPAASVPATLPSALRPAKSAVPAVYTIARGDTISAVAGRYGLDTYAVLKLNKLQANTIIYPGQKIRAHGLGVDAGSDSGRTGHLRFRRSSSVSSVLWRGPGLRREGGRHAGRHRRPPRRWAFRGLRVERAQHGLHHLPRPEGQGWRQFQHPGSLRSRCDDNGTRNAVDVDQIRFLHHQGRRHPLRHRGTQRRPALGRPVRQPADDVQHHLPGAEARHSRRVDDRAGVEQACCHARRSCPARSSGSATRQLWSARPTRTRPCSTRPRSPAANR